MPFFNDSSVSPLEGRSLLAYYCNLYGISMQDFPNPGTPFTPQTGIYLREGLLDTSDPTMLIWKNPDGTVPPPSPLLAEVQSKWHMFQRLFVDRVSEVFMSDEWESQWTAIVEKYKRVTFRDFVLMDAIPSWDSSDPGNFGGLGLTEDESDLFYAIGFGDGSWGAFYDICCIYPIRTACFGFGSNLQLIDGLYDSDGNFTPGPYADRASLADSFGSSFESPKYRGVRTISDCILYQPARDGVSFYDHAVGGLGLLTSSRVTGIVKNSDGSITVRYRRPDGITYSSVFDHVVITIPTWLVELDIYPKRKQKEAAPQEGVNTWSYQ